MSDLIGRIASSGSLDGETRKEIVKEYGTRGERALAAIDEKRVRKYLDFFVVISSSNEYVADEEICTCGDFMFRGRECWHILAVRLAAATNSFVEDASWYQDRWKEPGKE